MPTPRQTVADILRAARGKIERPENWTQEAFHRDRYGYWCLSDDAVCWCAKGAMLAVRGRFWDLDITDGLDALTAAAGCYITSFNDTHTHAEVIDAFDRAIAASESAP
jgi:hypothetical protein